MANSDESDCESGIGVLVIGLASGLAGWNGAQYIKGATVSLMEKYMGKLLFNGNIIRSLSASNLVTLVNTLLKNTVKFFKKG